MVRVTPKDAQAMKDAYAKMYAPKDESNVEADSQEEFEEIEDLEAKHYESNDE